VPKTDGTSGNDGVVVGGGDLVRHNSLVVGGQEIVRQNSLSVGWYDDLEQVEHLFSFHETDQNAGDEALSLLDLYD
jgi:hypothetical protein